MDTPADKQADRQTQTSKIPEGRNWPHLESQEHDRELQMVVRIKSTPVPQGTATQKFVEGLHDYL